MIVRQLCLRQARNASFLVQTPRRLARFSSTDSTTTTTTTTTPTTQTPNVTQEVLTQEEKQLFKEAFEATAGSEVTPAPEPAAPGSGSAVPDAQSTWEYKKHRTHIPQVYKSESVLDKPPRPADVTLEMLLTAQSHLGHTTSRWNPQNARYIFGIREGIHIISLDVTAAYLRRAAKVVEEVARCGGLILFVGTRPGQKKAVVRAAQMAKGYHVFERWIPGSLTNSQQILGNCAVKAVNALDKELPEYTNRIAMETAVKPDLVVCFNPVENEVLLHECGLNNIPTIGVIDTDADPTRVTYPIPANDDSLSCLEIVAGVLGRAGQEGQRLRLEEAKRGALTYIPVSMSKFNKDEATTGES
ncbi:37S ribosomal protein mrp4, mitochondrial [Talaromyces islandicus]|uniref:37S ribosomal protein mrp4, mitochondrial n=1 Tax=Talaromyces islandicus TaxID=28573 RepID=A0A0U1LPT0_TALIS|nr:37S ribosomal protein mrp4, mitochondrial [Talaromyces islandicus]